MASSEEDIQRAVAGAVSQAFRECGENPPLVTTFQRFNRLLDRLIDDGFTWPELVALELMKQEERR